MKKLLAASALTLLLTVGSFGLAYARTVSVRGYTRSNGTYVQPSHRTSPDSTLFDNWSTKGNFNPYTGKAGTVNP
jgi:hypothetical protein